jgi:hypothetical protein
MQAIKESGLERSDVIEYITPAPDMYGFSWGRLLHGGREIYVENGGGKTFSAVNLLMEAMEIRAIMREESIVQRMG